MANMISQEYSGRLHFATDAWTSPNHRAFIAWMVHLEHDGEPLCFLLDIIEVAEVRVALVSEPAHLIGIQSHSGEVMAKAFQSTLEQFGLAKKVCLNFPLCFNPTTDGH